jgi:hypothetical protein
MPDFFLQKGLERKTLHHEALRRMLLNLDRGVEQPGSSSGS